MIEPEQHPELAGLTTKISGARRGKVLNLYKALLHSPQLAESWFGHLNAVRWGTTLHGRLRELIIIRVAFLVGAAYALRQHIPKLATAEGVSEETCKALSDWRSSALFSAAERAALEYTDAVTNSATVSDQVFAALAAHYDTRSILEITVLAATYNMHARVTNALQIDLEQDP